MALQKAKKLSTTNDRISDLPDALLYHILSMLPTYYAVSTTILSSRFKNLWKNISHLTFDDSLPPSNNVRFTKFVNRVLLLHNTQPLEKLSLKIMTKIKPDNVNKWISHAIMKGIQSLDLTIKDVFKQRGGIVEVPSSLFTWKTLEDLTLKGSRLLINSQTTYCLPKLRKLELVSVKYQNNESARKLISSCVSLKSLVQVYDIDTMPSSTRRNLKFDTSFVNNHIYIDDYKVLSFESLEVLVLRNAYIRIMDDNVRSICLPNLRILELRNMDGDNYFEFVSDLIYLVGKSLESLVIDEIDNRTWKNNNMFVINAPALKVLHLKIYVRVGSSVDIHLENLPSLDKAFIEINHGFVNKNSYQALQNAKTITLWQGESEGIVPMDVFPIFHRLTVLKLEYVCGWGMMQELIKNSTRLEKLTLILNYCRCDNHEILCWTNPMTVPVCLLSCLRSMRIFAFNGLEDEIAMVNYILENARVLQTMEISACFSLDKKKMKNLNEEFLKIHRGSRKCKLSIH